MENEIWKKVTLPLYKDYYSVSNLGRVMRIAKTIIRSNGVPQTFNDRILNPSLDKDGYQQVSFSHQGVVVVKKVHRVVAESFIGEIPLGYEINHLDGNRANNAVSNLEIVTASENMLHSYRVLNRPLKGAVVNNKVPVIAYTIKERKSQKSEAEKDIVFKRFDSVLEASQGLGTSASISACCKGKQKSAFGFIWEYAS